MATWPERKIVESAEMPNVKSEYAHFSKSNLAMSLRRLT